MELTQEYLKKCLHYDPDTGVFTWRERPVGHFKLVRTWKTWNIRYAGKVCGSVDGKGYLHISLSGKFYRLHRLAFFYMRGVWPKGEVDHQNHDRSDNSWSNLREATVSENRRNQSLNSKSTCGVSGVYWNRNCRKWVAQIKVDGEVIYLGMYESKAQASRARKTAERTYGFHENHGLPRPEKQLNVGFQSNA